MSSINSIRRHVHHLSVEIGPRGSTTHEEEQAAKYAEDVYKELGLSPLVESFSSARSAWYPFTLGTLLVLAAESMFLLGGFAGAVIASLLTVIVILSLVQELSFRSNIFRFILPKGQSQNVSALIEPTGEAKKTIVLVGHLDTHRVPISHRSPRWFAIFSRLTTLNFVSVILMLILFLIRLFINWVLLSYVTLLLSIPVFMLFLVAISADFTPYSHGANDNATGAAVVMGLAEWLTIEPLQNTRIWVVNTGCEEVGAYGATAWVDGHLDELGDAFYLTLDNIGGGGPCYLTKETLIFPFESNPDLIELADRLAEQNPELGAYSMEHKAAYTDGAIGIRAGLRCLTFVGYRRDGIVPNWHQSSDVFENIDWDVVERTDRFVWLLIQAIDRDY